MVCCLALDAVLGLHVQFISHLIAVVGKEIVIERFAVTGNAASDGGGVRREDGGDGRDMFVDIQCAETRHPLMSLIDDALVLVEEAMVEALHHTACGIGEHRSLIVVAIGVEGIHLEVVPEAAVDLVLLREEGLEIHQHHDGVARNLPAAHAHMERLLGSRTAPVGPQLLIFNKKGIRLVCPEIRTNENDAVRHSILKRLRTRRKNGVNSTNLVTDFPTRLKDIVGKEELFIHLP